MLRSGCRWFSARPARAPTARADTDSTETLPPERRLAPAPPHARETPPRSAAPVPRRCPGRASRRASKRPCLSHAVILHHGHANHRAHFKQSRSRARADSFRQILPVFMLDARRFFGEEAGSIAVGQIGG